MNKTTKSCLWDPLHSKSWKGGTKGHTKSWKGGRKNPLNPENKQQKEERKYTEKYVYRCQDILELIGPFWPFRIENQGLSYILIIFHDLSWQYLSGHSYVIYSLLLVVFLIMQMSVNLFITLQKYTQQIDLTKKDWLPDRVFISRKFTHLTIHPQKNNKKTHQTKNLDQHKY